MNGYYYGAPMTQSQRAAYNDGIRAGRADRLLGRVSDYARICFANEPDYVRYYSAGYNRGQLGPMN
jgi:hypothetical protein